MLKRAGRGPVEIKRKLGKGQRLVVRCQRSESMSKARGRMAVSGSPRSRDGRTGGTDLLAERVAAVVRLEVLKFFEGGEEISK